MSKYIDHIFYINLQHRIDRKEEIEGELSRFNLEGERFDAFSHKIGSCGCSKSHIGVLKLAKERGYSNVLILEDDFEFTISKDEFEINLKKFFESNIEYDVCFLSYNLQSAQTVDGFPFIQRVLSSQTASAYIVNHHFYDDLINLFSYSVSMFERNDYHWLYAHDQAWKQIQPLGNWFCFTDRMGKQRASLSDNTCVYTDYGV